MLKMPRPILLLLIVFFIGQLAYFYPQLPEKVASHFNASGQPDNWSSRNSFVIFTAIFGLFAAGFPVLVMFLIENAPFSLLNLPNKEYWLAEERRESSLAMIRQRFEWLSVGMLALINAVIYMTMQANIYKQPISPNILFLIIGFFAFVVIWIISFVMKFRIPS